MNDGMQPQVSPPTTFRNVGDDGRVVKSHPPMGTTLIQEYAYFFNSERASSMHRPDGKKLAFIFHICKTNILQDIECLDREIAEGHVTLRRATPDEIDNYEMRVDPKGTMKKKVTAEVEAEVKASLELQIREKLSKQLGIPIEEVPLASDAVTVRDISDEAKLAGSDLLNSKLDALRSGIKSGSGTIIPTGTGAIPPITPVSSANLTGVADSNQK